MRRVWLIALLWALLCGVHPAAAQENTMRLYIPRIGLAVQVGECPIVDHWYDTTQLGNGVCHLEGTATVSDTWARIVLAGHTPGAFDDLRLLRVGDQVVVWDAHAVEVYRVALMTITTVDDTRWLMPTPDETLTLITCSGARRLIVHTEREG